MKKVTAMVLCILMVFSVFALSMTAFAAEGSLNIVDNETQLLDNPTDVIYEEVWIESPTDSDGDGKRDLIYATIARPAATENGLKAAAIIEESPYYYSDWAPLWDELRNVDLETFSGSGNPDTSSRTYADVQWDGETHWGGHSYAELVAADFKPDWLPAERVSTGVGEANRIENWLSETNWRNYFISRGYAAINVHMLGGKMSEGLLSDGGYEECLAAASVVDWLNGRVKAYTSISEGEGWVEVKADWSNGKAAMNGTSYCGSLPLAAASTGVEGLTTIIPEAPVYSYYDYYRSNGMVWAPGGWQGEDSTCLLVICNTRYLDGAPVEVPEEWTAAAKALHDKIYVDVDRVTGDYSSYWDERNMAAFGDQIKCSILQTHGYGDWNVKFKQAALIWETCEKYGIEHRAIFHRGAHQSALSYDGIDIYGILHTWLDYYLYDIDNGALEKVPAVTALNNVTAEWETFDQWPQQGNLFTTLYFNGASSVGTLGTEQGETAVVSVKDTYIPALSEEERKGFSTDWSFGDGPLVTSWENYMTGGSEDAAAQDLTVAVPDRALYVSDVLTEDTVISGVTKVTVSLKADKDVGAVSAMLVDYGEVHDITAERGSSTVDLGNGSEASLNKPVLTEETTPYKIVTRGSVDLQNPNPAHESWIDAGDDNFVPAYYYQTVELDSETYYNYTWDLVPTDYTFEAGHRIGIVIYGADPAYTTRPYDATGMTVDTAASFVELPLVTK